MMISSKHEFNFRNNNRDMIHSSDHRYDRFFFEFLSQSREEFVIKEEMMLRTEMN